MLIRKIQIIRVETLMRRILAFILIGLISTPLKAGDSRLTFDDIFKNNIFHTADIGRITWIPGQDAYAFTKLDTVNKGYNVLSVDLVKNDTTVLVPSSALFIDDSPVAVQSFSFSKTGELILIQKSVHRIWRRSRSGTYAIYYRTSGKLLDLCPDEELRNVKISPDETQVAYVKSDNNIYVFNLKAKRERRLTRDGSETILNGHPGWLYEEEFSLVDGYRWSPDSKSIAFWREDQSMVKQFTIIDNTEYYPEPQSIYYPKAGETNPVMKIGIVGVTSGRIRWIDGGSDPDVYFPRMDWVAPEKSTDGKAKLAVPWLNRRQNDLQLWLVNPQTGKYKIVFEDQDPAWVDVNDDTHFLPAGDILLTSSRSGFRHIYRLSVSSGNLEQLTRGDWDVTSVVRVDEASGFIYFYGRRDGRINQTVYRVPIAGGEIEKITADIGWNRADFSPTGNCFILNYSSATSPPDYYLCDAEGRRLRVMKESDREQFKPYVFSKTEFMTIPTKDGKELDARIIKPRNFNPAKSYPIIINGYGMPGSKMVNNVWGGSGYYLNQLFAQAGYCVFSVDNRHTSGMGKANEDLGYGDIGKWLIKDHENALDYLGSLGFVDTSRVGVWGWSGGGYFTSLAMTKSPKYFDVGVAIAPVTDWKYYDTAYTERYMDLPRTNPDGYAASSALTHANQLRGKLLLIHGGADDNVHAQNTMVLINELVREGKAVDQFIYPGRNHGIYGGGATYYVFHQLLDYFLNNL